MALGAALKEARMRQKLTASEVANGTRMKVQVVTALEEEDFGKIAAPIYAKGFIRLYAEFVGLDPQALVAEYVERFTGGSQEDEPEDESESVAARRSVVQRVPDEPEDEPEVADTSFSASVDQLDLLEPDVREPNVRAPAVGRSAPARSVPPVSLPLDDDELDLFSEIEPPTNDRRGILMDDGYKEAMPSVKDRIAHALAEGVDAVQQVADSVAGACRRACGGGSSWISRLWKRLGDTIVARRRELTQIDFKNLSARHMMALIGLLVLVLLIISSLSRCVRGRRMGEGLESPAPLPAAAAPVDVYLD